MGSAVRGATGETINNNFDLTLRNRRPTRRVKVVVDGASHNLSGIKRKTYKTKRTEKDARLYARPRILFLQEIGSRRFPGSDVYWPIAFFNAYAS